MVGRSIQTAFIEVYHQLLVLDYLFASLTTLCLVFFFACVNVVNLMHNKVEKNGKNLPATVRASEGRGSNLLGFGSLIFWFEVLIFPLLFLTNLSHWLFEPPFSIRFPLDSGAQTLGFVLLFCGFLIFSWSILARGQYAVSWNMPKGHKLVTWGPYKYVRHPSYLAYFLLFLGLFFAWLNIAAVPCLAAIPGYILNVGTEEKMLIDRFGDEYRLYQQRTGRFFPLIRKRKKRVKAR